ncbi:MAG: hypothetical protein KDA58_02120 [Planctomycetaceae bacterium]|nr:hypothetical protein [Planctomycetaceae bacterium]
MSYSESLTVRILGDSSGLQRELDSVMQSLSTLQRDIESASRAGARIGDALSRVSRATGPLRQVSSLLTGVSQQARALSAQAISLNVAPAIAALQRLMQLAAAAAAQLQALSFTGPAPVSSPVASGSAGAGGGGAPTSRVGRGMASGGLVTGPTGIDRIPVRLSAGEYVLNQNAVRTMGHSLVDQLNQQPELMSQWQRSQTSLSLPVIANAGQSQLNNRPASQASAAALTAQRHSSSEARLPIRGEMPSSGANAVAPRPVFTSNAVTPSIQRTMVHEETHHNTSNHFGGITIHVQQSADLGDLVQNLDQQARTLRNRRG